MPTYTKGRKPPALGSRKLPGTTLLELVIALAIIGIISGPMIAIINAATQSSVKVREASVSTYIAKLCVEQMVNLTRLELDTDWTVQGPGVGSRDITNPALIGSNEYLIRTHLKRNLNGVARHGWITYQDPTAGPVTKYLPELSEITVEVYTNKNNVLAFMCSYTDVIFTGASHIQSVPADNSVTPPVPAVAGCATSGTCLSGCPLKDDKS